MAAVRAMSVDYRALTSLALDKTISVNCCICSNNATQVRRFWTQILTTETNSTGTRRTGCPRVVRWPLSAAARAAPALPLYRPAEVFDRFGHAARFDIGAVANGYGWVLPKRPQMQRRSSVEACRRAAPSTTILHHTRPIVSPGTQPVAAMARNLFHR